METITFKLPSDIMDALEKRADQFKGLSRHQMAQRIVIDYFQDARSRSIESELIELRSELNKLRDNLASSLQAMLLMGGKITDLKEAQRWAAKTFY